MAKKNHNLIPNWNNYIKSKIRISTKRVIDYYYKIAFNDFWQPRTLPWLCFISSWRRRPNNVKSSPDVTSLGNWPYCWYCNLLYCKFTYISNFHQILSNNIPILFINFHHNISMRNKRLVKNRIIIKQALYIWEIHIFQLFKIK